MKKIINSVSKLRNGLNRTPTKRYVKEREMGQGIPKIIHQTYYHNPESDSCPEEIKNNVLRIKALNPSWEYKFYDDEAILNFIKQNFPELLGFYKKISPEYGAARADFFRYLVIYSEGGVYLDIKSGIEKPLDDLIFDDDSYLLSHWPSHYPKGFQGRHAAITNSIGELQQWHIASIPGHPFLLNVINRVCENIKRYNPIIHDYGSKGVINLTGPVAYTEAIYPWLDHYPHRLEKDHEVLGFTYTTDTNLLGHHKLYSKTHYSGLDVPVVKVAFYKLALFNLMKPLIKSVRNKE